MSLLASLIQASSQFQQAMENRRASAEAREQSASKAQPAAPATPEPAGSPGDDRFTPSDSLANPSDRKTRQLPLTNYKQTVGQDVAFVRETLRHKLAEYNLHPATTVNVSRKDDGELRVDGKISDNVRQQVEKDLNNNTAFKEAFSRLSSTEPTLRFMDNAVKLNQAYGVNNSLLDNLVSENQQFNGLHDVIHRYDTLRKTAGAQQIEAAGNGQRYAFSLNARA
jgi:hypothetical protein